MVAIDTLTNTVIAGVMEFVEMTGPEHSRTIDSGRQEAAKSALHFIQRFA
jgi:hypothetical protein